MNTKFKVLLIVFAFGVTLAACDLFDPSNVENPNVLTDGFLDLENSAEFCSMAWNAR